MNPVKPGVQTSEFWATVATQVIAVVSLFYPDLGANVLGKWVQPFAIVAAALATVVYTHTRGKVKSAAVVVPRAAPVGTDHNPVPALPTVTADEAFAAYPKPKATRRARNA